MGRGTEVEAEGGRSAGRHFLGQRCRRGHAQHPEGELQSPFDHRPGL